MELLVMEFAYNYRSKHPFLLHECLSKMKTEALGPKIYVLPFHFLLLLVRYFGQWSKKAACVMLFILKCKTKLRENIRGILGYLYVRYETNFCFDIIKIVCERKLGSNICGDFMPRNCSSRLVPCLCAKFTQCCTSLKEL